MQPVNSIYDVIVLGGGIAGAATADALTQQGIHTLLIDQFEPGHEYGSSHGDGRIIRLAYPEPIYLEMAQLAYKAWAELSERAGETLLQISGGIDCGAIGSQMLAELEENYSRFNIPFERLSAVETAQHFPQIHLDEGSEAIFQADGGVVFATAAVKALWRLVEENGGETVTDERIEQIVIQREHLQLRSESGKTWTTQRLVIAAGGWSRQLLSNLNLDLPLSVTQEQVAYFPVKGNIDHRVGVMPVLIDHHGSDNFYVLPQVDIPGVKVGWHHTGPEITPEHRPPVDTENVAGMEGFVRWRFPRLEPTAFEVVRCLYTSTPDHHFILDKHPQLPNVVIGTGFSGHGFKFGPVLGQILATLATDEPAPVALDQFSINRLENMTQL